MDEKMDGKGPIILLLSSPILSVIYSILGGCADELANIRASLRMRERLRGPEACRTVELQKRRGGGSKARFKVKKEDRRGKVPLYWHVVWMVEVETRIPGG